MKTKKKRSAPYTSGMSGRILLDLSRKSFYPHTLERYGKVAPPLRFDGNRPPRDTWESSIYMDYATSFLEVMGKKIVPLDPSFQERYAELVASMGKGEMERFTRALLDAGFYETLYYWKMQNYLVADKDRKDHYEIVFDDDAAGLMYTALLHFLQAYRYDRTGEPPELPQGIEGFVENYRNLEAKLAETGHLHTLKALPVASAFAHLYQKEFAYTTFDYFKSLEILKEEKTLIDFIGYAKRAGLGHLFGATPEFPHTSQEIAVLEQIAGEARRLSGQLAEAWLFMGFNYAALGLEDALREFRQKGYIEVSPTQPRFVGGFLEDPDAPLHTWHLRYLGRVQNAKGEVVEVWEHALDMGLGLGDEQGHFGEVVSQIEVRSRDGRHNYTVWFRHTHDEEAWRIIDGTLLVATNTSPWILDNHIVVADRDWFFREDLLAPIPTTVQGMTIPPTLDEEERKRRLAHASLALEAGMAFHRHLFAVSPLMRPSGIDPSYPLLRHVSYQDGTPLVVYEIREPQGASSIPGKQVELADWNLELPEGLAKEPLKARLRIVGPEPLQRFSKGLEEAWPEYVYGVMLGGVALGVLDRSFLADSLAIYSSVHKWLPHQASKEYRAIPYGVRTPEGEERWLKAMVRLHESLAGHLSGGKGDERIQKTTLLTTLGVAWYVADMWRQRINISRDLPPLEMAPDFLARLREAVREHREKWNLPPTMEWPIGKEYSRALFASVAEEAMQYKSGVQGMAETLGVSEMEMHRIIDEWEKGR